MLAESFIHRKFPRNFHFHIEHIKLLLVPREALQSSQTKLQATEINFDGLPSLTSHLIRRALREIDGFGAEMRVDHKILDEKDRRTSAIRDGRSCTMKFNLR